MMGGNRDREPSKEEAQEAVDKLNRESGSDWELVEDEGD